MPASELTIYIVDDDSAARESLEALVSPIGVRTRTFPAAEDLLEAVTPHDYGCVVTDLRLVGMSGLELKKKLNDRGIDIPTIVLTGYADVRVAVQAMQMGAVTLLEKPAGGIELWEAIQLALRQDEQRRVKQTAQRSLRRRVRSLSNKEREVMQLMVSGLPNKTIARRLDVSLRTVESRRKAVFDKLGARSLAVLVQLVMQAGELTQPDEPQVLVTA